MKSHSARVGLSWESAGKRVARRKWLILACVLMPLPSVRSTCPPACGILNDNWRSTQQAEIIATTIPPSNDLESAIVKTLTPGNYTAIIKGKNNATGLALVEVYALN